MAVLRIHKKQQNFVILDKTCLNDKGLSWGAKGLHAYLLSLPDDWKVQVSDLKDRAKNGRDAVRGLLSELEQAGYIQKSARRDDTSGRFGGVEYLVLEIPEPKIHDITPGAENQSSVKNAQNTPGTENQSLVYPATGNPLLENPTLINSNRISNNKIINKTAATKSDSSNALSEEPKPEAAAIFNSFLTANKKPLFQEPLPEDSLIGSTLTAHQLQQVRNLVDSMQAPSPESLISEIEYCLLNANHFTACGKDFGWKLNAIRKMIVRGGWQKPTGMVIGSQKKSKSEVNELDEQLKEAYAESAHFKRLMSSTRKLEIRARFEGYIESAQEKIRALEEQIRLFSQVEAGKI